MIIFFLFFSIVTPIESKKSNGGFSTEIIHIDSPLSPFPNPNLTYEGSLNHRHHIEQIGSSNIKFDRSSYLMKISYGTPSVKYYCVIDTGSDLCWIQCLPCTHCYQSKFSPFNPSKSRTFHFENRTYNRTYEDNSHCRGELARETITLGSRSSKKEFKNFLFGCGHDNAGSFPQKSGGLVGFNLQESSFITQLRSEHGGKFSYCFGLPGSTYAGKISFGHDAMVSGTNVMTTPLIVDSYYNIMLEAITVGSQRINFLSPKTNSDARINVQLKVLIDTGLNVLLLSKSFYPDVENSVKNHIKGKSPVGAQGAYKLCYSSSLKDSSIPKIKLHFPGVVMELNPYNSFVTSSEYRCLAILSTNATSTLGNMAQINFQVGYNLVEKKASFKPTNCARL